MATTTKRARVKRVKVVHVHVARGLSPILVTGNDEGGTLTDLTILAVIMPMRI